MAKLMGFLYEVWQIILVFIIISIILVLTQRQQLYHPRSYNAADKKLIPYTKKINYSVAGSQQTAYLYPPSENPKKIWVLLGGNAAIALQWLRLLQHIKLADTSFLLVDYPGYGQNQGYPSERNNTQAVIAAYQALQEHIKTKPELFLMGHSLGSAIAIDAASTLQPKVLVLLSPFTSIYDMAKRSLSPPWAWLLKGFIWDTYLSEQKLTKLSKTNPNMKVYILHGTNDTIVPASMGRKLAKAHPKSHYQELPKTGHQLPFEAENKVKDIIINTSSSS